MNILDLRANVLWEKYHPRLGGINESVNEIQVLPSITFTVLLVSLLFLLRLIFRM